MGLLDYVTSHSMDEDYVHVAERRKGAPPTAGSGAAAMVILALFGLLVVTAAVQTSRNASTAQSSHDQLVTQIKARTSQLGARRDHIAALEQEVSRLQSQFLDATTQGRALSNRLNTLGVLTGEVAVTGPGVKVVVDDAPGATSASQRVLDKDLQKLVNALWQSGAEAISINGQRLTNLSAIRQAGEAITVNFRSLTRPYVVTAIGNRNQMPARFLETRHGSAWLDLQKAYNLQFTMTPEESLKVPAARRLSLRYATTAEGRR